MAPLCYLTFDETGLITRANLTACGLLGIERSRFVKKPFALFVHPESQDTFYFHIRKVLEATARQTYQLVLKRKGGPLTQTPRSPTSSIPQDGGPRHDGGRHRHGFNNILAVIIGFTELG